MEKERVNLYVTKCQLDLILESVLRCRYSWKRTYEAMMKGDDNAPDVEECTTGCEAEFMQEEYEKLSEELRARVKEVGVNEIDVVASDYVGRANLTLEIIKLSKEGNERIVCVYNCRGLDYYFFPDLWEMIQFFDEGKEPEYVFSSDRELDLFLRYV